MSVSFHAWAQIIVFAWVDDQDAKRACESADAACRIFRRVPDSGRPPSEWTPLLTDARAESTRRVGLAPGGAT